MMNYLFHVMLSILHVTSHKINEKKNDSINFENKLEFKIEEFMKKFDGHKYVVDSDNKEHYEDNTSIDNLL